MVDFCRWKPFQRCWHGGVCSFLDVQGNVVCCRVVSNPSGFFMRRKVHPSYPSIFARSRRGDV